MISGIFDFVQRSIEIPKIDWSSHNVINDRLITNVKNLMDYKKNKLLRIPEDFFLYSLISNLPKSNNKNYYEKMDIVYLEGLQLSSSLGMITINNDNIPTYEGIFAGKCGEVWIATMDNYSNSRITESNIKPIRCIYHPFTSLNFWLEEPEPIFREEISFFIVDLIALSKLINYHYKNYRSFSTKKFISQTLLPLILEDVIKITMFNRLNGVYNQDYDTSEKPRLIPTWLDLNNEVMVMQKNIIDTLQRTKYGIDLLVINSLLLDNISLGDFIYSLPRIQYNTNILSLLLTALSPYLIYLLSLNKTIKGVKDHIVLNNISVQLNILENDKTILSEHPYLKEQQIRLFKELKKLTR